MSLSTASPPLTLDPSRSPLRSRRTWIFIILGMLALVFLVFVSAPTSKDGSTYLRSPTGYSEWYGYMLEQGNSVQRWQRSYEHLEGTGQTLVQVWGGTPDALSVWKLQEWVGKGNTLVRLSWWGDLTNAPFSSALNSPMGPVVVETTRRFTSSSGGKTLLQDRGGAVVRMNRLEQGQIIDITYPWLAANAYQKQRSNYEFLARLVQYRGGIIWVDEWLHGYRDSEKSTNAEQSDRNVFDYLLQTPMVILVAQAIVLLLLLIWDRNRRFGPILTLNPPQTANSERYIQALAGVLNTARHTHFVVEQLGERFRLELAIALGITADQSPTSPLPDDEQLAQLWASRTGHSPQELVSLLHQSRNNQRLTDRDLLIWAKKANAIIAKTI